MLQERPELEASTLKVLASHLREAELNGSASVSWHDELQVKLILISLSQLENQANPASIDDLI